MNSEKYSQWHNYHDEYIDKEGKLISNSRFNRVVELLTEFSPKSVLELAGNAGVLSELVLQRINNIRVICTDYDSLAIDSMFSRLKNDKISNLFCAKFDFMVTENSSAEIASENRLKSDCVLALAVTHHLLLTQGYSYNNIFERIKLYTKQYVFIEFMPLGLWNGKTAPTLPPWYTQEEFKKAFSSYFEILKIEKLDENRILFVGKAKN